MRDLTRSIDITADGRTLEGLAFRWDHPSLVADPGARPYLEEFARGSTDKTLRERGVFPLLKYHRADRDPVGVVQFRPATEGLMFTAPLSSTTEASETLELVNDGALRSVSVRFTPIKQRRRASADGIVTTRTEVRLRELSLAPTGFGLHEGAMVTAVRADLEELEDAAAGADLEVRRRLLLARIAALT